MGKHSTFKEMPSHASKIRSFQIEFANVVLVNKTDLVTEEEAQVVERTVRVLNPSARVHRTQLSRVPLSQVMGTGLFDMREAEESAGWLRSLTEEVTPESEEYGIGSFVYRARAPFHPGRLVALLESILMVVYIWDVYEVLLSFLHRQSVRQCRLERLGICVQYTNLEY